METNDYKCEICFNVFKSKSNLYNHKRTAKYCLKMQNKENDKYQCEYCDKKFTTKYSLELHCMSCNARKELENKENDNNHKKQLRDQENKHNKQLKEMENNYKQQLKEQENKHKQHLKEWLREMENKHKQQLKEQEEKYETKIKDLQNQIKELATLAISKPTNIHNGNTQQINQIINNLTPITEQHLKEQAEFLTLDHIKNGVNGYVQYALEYPLKDKIICTDYSRRKIKYKDEKGDVTSDPEMATLSQKLFKAIDEKNTILINEYIKELQIKYNLVMTDPNNEMNDDESKEFDIKLNTLLEELFKVKGQRKDVYDISNGSKNETYYEFIKNICAKTIK